MTNPFTVVATVLSMQKLLTFLQQKNITVFAKFQGRNFNVTLADTFVLGPGFLG